MAGRGEIDDIRFIKRHESILRGKDYVALIEDAYYNEEIPDLNSDKYLLTV